MDSLSARMHRAYLSLGSNLGDSARLLRDCIARLGALGEVKNVSHSYETEPMENVNQPWFLNCAVELATPLEAHALLAAVRWIEAEMGRTREVPKGPRTIDIDILLFDEQVVADPELQIPHPAMARRRFVLLPLAEIAPELRDPVSGNTIRELLDALGEGGGAVVKQSC